GTAEARRARRRTDSEHTRGRSPVELEQDTERDHLALGSRQLGERRLEPRREALAEGALRGLRLAARIPRFTAAPPLLGAEVVERGVARDLAEPRARRGSPRIEAPP